MQTFIIILLKSVACSGILFAWYLLFLKNKKLHGYNRLYLLATTVLSLVIPFLQFKVYELQRIASKPIELLNPEAGANYIEPLEQATAKSFPLEQFSAGLYLLVSLVLFSLLLFRLAWIRRVKRKGTPDPGNDYTIIYTECGQAPFSFGRYLFWRSDIAIDSPEGEQILRHELHHIYARHTADKLFMQLVVTFAWANPIFWFIKKELAMQHEFSADDSAIADSDTDAFARMILQAQYSNISPDIIHPFFHSSIKRRLTMLTNSKKTKFSFLRRAMLLPLAASAVVLLSFKLHVSEVSVARSPISVVFDAGHGGHDNGATGVNGLLEKDLNLKICNKLVELAPEYNVKASLTRKNDNFISLPDRVALSENSNPDLFIAIHVDKSTRAERNGGNETPEHIAVGFEVLVSGKNKYPAQSRLLASAIVPEISKLSVSAKLVQRGAMVISEANRPAVLIECGNIDDARQMAMLTNDASLEKFCRQILSGIANYQNNKK